MATCKHCETPAIARGLCGRHYQRLAKWGDPLREKPTEKERFMRLVAEDRAGCWLWAGTRLPQGYGQFRTGSVIDGSRRYERAHRAAWRLFKGPIPGDLVVCHACDNPPCVNPGHLFLGTLSDNAQDALAKGRLRARESHPGAKLTEADVASIRCTDESAASLAARLGVTESHVYRIRRAERWGGGNGHA